MDHKAHSGSNQAQISHRSRCAEQQSMLLQLLLAQAPVGSLPLSCSRIGTLRLPRMPFGSNDLLLFKLPKRHDEML